MTFPLPRPVLGERSRLDLASLSATLQPLLKRTRILAMAVGLGYLAIFAITVALTVQIGWTDARERAESEARAHAQTVAASFRWLLRAGDQAAANVSGALAGDASGALARERARGVLAGLEGAVGLTIYDESGQARLREGEPDTAGPPAMDLAGPRIEAGPTLDRFRLVAPVGLPGGGRGAVAISFGPALIGGIWDGLRLDQDSPVTLLANDGTPLLRYPVPSEGIKVDRDYFVKRIASLQGGSVDTATSQFDGRRRLVAMEPIPEAQLAVVSTRSEHDAFRGFRSNVRSLLLITVPTALALIVASLLILRLQQRDEKQQRELTAALTSNRMLLRDTHHRVKNNLQSVVSLVRMQQIPDAAKRDLQNRVSAMAAVHEAMYSLDQYSELEADQFLPQVVDRQLAGSERRAICSFDVDPVLIDRDHATPLALLTSEVIANALKHARPVGDLRLQLSLKREGEPGHCVLTIRDNGQGFDPQAMAAGMGSRIIRGMTMQLNGSFGYAEEGGMVFTADVETHARGATRSHY